MQEEDWGTYTQAPWRTGGGAWNDTDNSNHPKKQNNKTRKRSTSKTATHDSSEENNSSQEGDHTFRTEMQQDRANLHLELQRWTFARSWRRRVAALTDELEDLSPRSSRAGDIKKEEAAAAAKRTDDDKAPLFASTTTPQSLDRRFIGLYLDGCVAAAESQLAGGRNGLKWEEKGAVREIQRLVERVVRLAELDG